MPLAQQKRKSTSWGRIKDQSKLWNISDPKSGPIETVGHINLHKRQTGLMWELVKTIMD
jgi:hypothetical protein